MNNSGTFSLEFGGTDQRVVKMLRDLGPRLLRVMLPEMDRQMQLLETYIRTEKLEGQVLKHRTGKLEGSVNAEKSRVVGDVIEGYVKQDSAIAPYGKVHEFGGTYVIKEHARRVAFNAKGERIKLLTKHGLTSTRKEIASVGEHLVREHSATFPERSFMRSSLAERSPAILDALRTTLAEQLTKIGGAE